jgi:hypothetical protein
MVGLDPRVTVIRTLSLEMVDPIHLLTAARTYGMAVEVVPVLGVTASTDPILAVKEVMVEMVVLL